ncbi:MAG TPA: hypothetical protein VGH45_08370 [Solirubrobacteraceae bacterium]|jgi:hypothetical protein
MLHTALTFRIQLETNFLDVPGQRAGFVVLAAFLGTFLFIRTSARLMRSPKVPWWPGSVTTESGLHLHHLVWGIVLIMLCGFLGYVVNPLSPWNEILAGFFGVGCGLTMDEFALWIYLRDVYWAKEGRVSFDAVVVATVIGALLVLGVAPLDIPRNASSITTLILTVGLDVGLAVTTILRGKPLLGMVGIFFFPASIVGVVRLASPRSPWARRFYSDDGKRMERSRERWRRIEARRRRVSDLIAGAPAPDAPDS